MLNKHITITVFLLIIIFNTSADSGADEDFRLLWKYAAGGELTSSPAVSDDGRVYLYAEDRHIHALDRNGRFLWKFRLSGRPAEALSVSSDGSIYACTEEGVLYAVNPDGEVLWQFDTGGSPAGDPSVSSNGTIFLALVTGELFALSHNGKLRWQLYTGVEVTQSPVVDSGTAVYLLSASGMIISCAPWGSENWRYQPEQSSIDDLRTAVIHDHILYSSRGANFEAVDPDGILLWSRVIEEACESIMMYGDGICGISESGRAFGRSLAGDLQWETEKGLYRGYPASSRDGIYMLGTDGGIKLLSFSGELVAQTQAEGVLTQHILTDKMLISGSEEWIIYAFSASGPDRTIWSQRGRDAAHGGRTGENRFVFDESLYRGHLDYVFLKTMLDTPSLSNREMVLSDIAERIGSSTGSGGLNYILPLLYRALGEGRLRIFSGGMAGSSTDYPSIRSESARLIGRIGDFESVGFLVKMLEEEEDNIVCAAIIDALGELGTNNRKMSLQAVYTKIESGRTTGTDDRIAASAIKAVELISEYSGSSGSGYGYRILLEIYRGNYSKNIRDSAKDLLRRMK
jgi:outer membrane protein assembly factor BamB